MLYLVSTQFNAVNPIAFHFDQQTNVPNEAQ